MGRVYIIIGTDLGCGKGLYIGTDLGCGKGLYIGTDLGCGKGLYNYRQFYLQRLILK